MFSTQLKTRTHLEFSLDKDNKVREQYSINSLYSILIAPYSPKGGGIGLVN